MSEKIIRAEIRTIPHHSGSGEEFVIEIFGNSGRSMTFARLRSISEVETSLNRLMEKQGSFEIVRH